MQFLTPGLFNVLVVIAIVIAVIAAGLRLYHDFRRGPRWPQDSGSPQAPDQPDQADKQEKPIDD